MSSKHFPLLRDEIRKIDRPGQFCGRGIGPEVLPGLTVERAGGISFPLTAEAAERLKSVCEQAPYGKGEQTLVDTSVRRVWHLSPGKFQLLNRQWEEQLNSLLPTIAEQLGLDNIRLSAHLYDLLLYEPGSFFLPHRDGEKEAGMVATLVIALPSQFEGGELIVRHEGQEVTIDLGGPQSAYQSQYAVFYADCEHEVKPLRSGYRLALVYNLTLPRGKKPLSAPNNQQHVEPIARILNDWAKQPESHRLAVLLKHAYTKANLSWENLKGIDRVQADILAAAAAKAECQAYVALLTYHKSGAAEYVIRNRKDRSLRGSGEAANYTMGELIEDELYASRLQAPAGEPPAFDRLRIEQGDLIDPEGLTAIDPEVQFEGYTGNAGMTLDYWYRHAAIFIWPNREHYAVYCDAGAGTALPVFLELTDRLKAEPKNAELRAQCVSFASRLMRCQPRRRYSRFAEHGPSSRDLLLGLSIIDDETLIQRYFTEVLVSDQSLRPGPALFTLARKHGWTRYAPVLQSLFATTEEGTDLARNLELLAYICQAPSRAEGWAELCAALTGIFLDRLEAIDSPPATTPGFWPRRTQDRSGVLAHLLRALLAAQLEPALERFLKHTNTRADSYPAVQRITAILALAEWLEKKQPPLSESFLAWVAEARRHLEARTANEPQPPADQQRDDSSITCKCKFCTPLKVFLRNATASEYRFAANESVRSHVQGHAQNVDLTFKLVKSSRPYTLVCTKNDKSYRQRLKTYQAELEQLNKFPQLQTAARPKHQAPSPTSRKKRK